MSTTDLSLMILLDYHCFLMKCLRYWDKFRFDIVFGSKKYKEHNEIYIPYVVITTVYLTIFETVHS